MNLMLLVLYLNSDEGTQQQGGRSLSQTGQRLGASTPRPKCHAGLLPYLKGEWYFRSAVENKRLPKAGAFGDELDVASAVF